MNRIKSEEKTNNTNNKTVLCKILYWMGFVLLLGIYLAIAQLTAIVAQSQEIFPIGNLRMPLSAYTGVVSAVSNICFIAMVIFYGKKGYITTLIVFAVRMVRMLYGVIILRNLPSIPGIATSIVLILSVTLIFNRN